MTRDIVKSCLACAWRADCAKRFSIGDDATLHCPDFSLDVTLNKDSATKSNDEEDTESK